MKGSVWMYASACILAESTTRRVWWEDVQHVSYQFGYDESMQPFVIMPDVRVLSCAYDDSYMMNISQVIEMRNNKKQEFVKEDNTIKLENVLIFLSSFDSLNDVYQLLNSSSCNNHLFGNEITGL